MIVALDGRKLLDGGIGTYIRGLLGAYAAVPDADRVVALVDPAQRARVAACGAVSVATVRAGKYGLLEHFVVASAARDAHADLLHEPHYTLPLGWRGRSVVTIHDLTHLRLPHLFPPGAALYARAMAGSAARRARFVITPSEAARRDVIERLGVGEAKVHAIALGVSPVFAPIAPQAVAEFRVAHQLPLGYVLYVGAHRRHKNLALLLDAWTAIPDSERPVLVITGDPWGPDHPLARHARERSVERWVSFVSGLSDDRELACLYSGAALYVQPSLAEGFGLPPLEALACGTPVLSSNAGSLAEVLGDAARLLPPRDPEAWAATIREMLADANGNAERVARGRAHAARFTWARAAAATRQVYAEAMG